MNSDSAEKIVSDALMALGGPGAASEKAGIPVRTLQNWASGKSKPPYDAVVLLMQLARPVRDGVKDSDLGNVPSYRASLQASAKRRFNPDRDRLLIRRFDVQLSAGSGSISDRAEELTPIPFAPDFFSKKLGGRNPERMVIVDARGDSMVPTLGDGDLVMIDTSEVDVRDAIYAVSYGDALFIKRLAKRGDRIDLISSNPEYPVERIEGPDLAQLEIIGRVVWIGRALV